MIKLKKLYYFVFLLIILSCFLIGGFTQFFIGLPNTLFSYGVLSLFYIYYFIYIGVKKIAFLDRVVVMFHLFAIIILISTAINNTPILKTVIYLIFVLLPLGCYSFFKINKKNEYISPALLSQIFLLIACIQMPIMLLQTVGYDFLVKFNQSSQDVSSVDFMFGTFFLKADHALGFFLLFNIINLYKNNKAYNITKYAKYIIWYLALTIFIGGSNVTKLILILLILYVIYNSFPKKVKIVGFFFALILLAAGSSWVQNIEAFEREAHFIETEYNVEKSYRNYERGIAKRPQVALVLMNRVPLKIIGEGPYAYFNVLTGEFTKTKHFSQLIWTYFDLGILGLITLILLLYAIVKNLGFSKAGTRILFIIVLVYAFMTTVFSDLAIMITLIGLLPETKD